MAPSSVLKTLRGCNPSGPHGWPSSAGRFALRMTDTTTDDDGGGAQTDAEALGAALDARAHADGGALRPEPLSQRRGRRG